MKKVWLLTWVFRYKLYIKQFHSNFHINSIPKFIPMQAFLRVLLTWKIPFKSVLYAFCIKEMYEWMI